MPSRNLGTSSKIKRIKLRFVADKPPPYHVFEQVALMAAEERGNIFDYS
jgi:hypothetical protein